jgi:hypothetical protein
MFNRGEAMQQVRRYSGTRWEHALERLLDAGCRVIAEVPGPNDSEIRFMARLDGKVIILQTFHGVRDGFEVYVPASDSPLIADTLKAALA